MGVDIYVLKFLMGIAPIHKRRLRRTLWLGRQGFHVKTEEARAVADEILRAHDPEISLDSVQPPSMPFAEGLFRYLGSTNLNALDASEYEGADIIHDLNTPVPREMIAAFDTVFDGGTIEHIYDIPAVFRNVSAMLDIGGLFLSVNAANNQLGHGLYQFSPELIWRAFGPESGFAIEAMYFMDVHGVPTLNRALDPGAEGKRLEIGMTAAPTYLCFAARKLRGDAGVSVVYQSDYSTAWRATGAARSD
jgi:hypothetical protein